MVVSRRTRLFVRPGANGIFGTEIVNVLTSIDDGATGYMYSMLWPEGEAACAGVALENITGATRTIIASVVLQDDASLVRSWADPAATRAM